MATIVKRSNKTGIAYQAIVRKGRFRDKPLKRTFSLKRDAEIWAREQEHLIDMKRHQDPRLAEMVTQIIQRIGGSIRFVKRSFNNYSISG